MTTYGRDIELVNGSCSVLGVAIPELALSQVVDLARSDGWHPPRWYEFWLPKCSDEVRAEYKKQTKA